MAFTGAAPLGGWRFSHPTFGEEVVEPRIRVWTHNADMLNPALIAGEGIALQHESFVWQQLRQGLLEVALSE